LQSKHVGSDVPGGALNNHAVSDNARYLVAADEGQPIDRTSAWQREGPVDQGSDVAWIEDDAPTAGSQEQVTRLFPNFHLGNRDCRFRIACRDPVEDDGGPREFRGDVLVASAAEYGPQYLPTIRGHDL